MSATLKMTHKAIGAEVRRGAYDILVDGQTAGSLEMNATIEISVEPGITPCRFVTAESPAGPRTSTPPKSELSPFVALERGFSRSSSCPSSSLAWP
jgi:hypothetical protein